MRSAVNARRNEETLARDSVYAIPLLPYLKPTVASRSWHIDLRLRVARQVEQARRLLEVALRGPLKGVVLPVILRLEREGDSLGWQL